MNETSCKAVIFDYVGTIVNCRNYTMEASKQKLYWALVAEGFDVAEDRFLQAYDLAHEKYRKVRYGQLREVTNAVWVAEALCYLGFAVTSDDPKIRSALNVFFQDFIDTLELRDGAKKLLRQMQRQCKIALISNFTYAPVIYKSLRKLRINEYFGVVAVSHQVGWRKPHSQIFQHTLNKLQIPAAEAVFVGDSPLEDIHGAKVAGLKTIFVSSQFNTLKTLRDCKEKPDFAAKDLKAVTEILSKLVI